MALTTYLDYAEVRAALGVNANELGDQVIALPVYEMGLIRELNKISTSLPAAFSAVDVLTEPRAAAAQTLWETTQLFAVYAVAKQVGVSLASFAPKDIGDGKATIGRFAGESYKKTLDGIEKMYDSMRASLADAYRDYIGSTTSTPSTMPFTMTAAVSRGVDPVTGS